MVSRYTYTYFQAEEPGHYHSENDSKSAATDPYAARW